MPSQEGLAPGVSPSRRALFLCLSLVGATAPGHVAAKKKEK